MVLRLSTHFIVNPSGSFEKGGPSADCGVTGRKIIVDSYGGAARHGGGAFSGKDASKVDRSGAYFCRFVAREVVRAGLARRAEVQVAYAIGQAEPVSVMVETFGTGDPAAAAHFVSRFRLPAGGDHRSAWPAPPDLPADHELRPLRQARATVGGAAMNAAGLVWGRTARLGPLPVLGLTCKQGKALWLRTELAFPTRLICHPIPADRRDRLPDGSKASING